MQNNKEKSKWQNIVPKITNIFAKLQIAILLQWTDNASRLIHPNEALTSS